MKNLKNLILVRHAAYEDEPNDAPLSSLGRQQALKLADSIKRTIGLSDIVIWSSSAKRAAETANIINQQIPLATLKIEEKLWSDDKHDEDFYWLNEKLQNFDGVHLVIVSHLEYVRQFPKRLGYSHNKATYACGVLIKDGKCTDFC